MKPPGERRRYPCMLVVLILVTVILILFLIQSYGTGWSSLLEPSGEGDSQGPLEQVVNSLRGVGRGLVDIFTNILR